MSPSKLQACNFLKEIKGIYTHSWSKLPHVIFFGHIRGPRQQQPGETASCCLCKDPNHFSQNCKWVNIFSFYFTKLLDWHRWLFHTTDLMMWPLMWQKEITHDTCLINNTSIGQPITLNLVLTLLSSGFCRFCKPW